MKFDSLMQNNISNTVMWSKSKLKWNFNVVDVCFSKPEIVIGYLSCGLSYNLYNVKCTKVPPMYQMMPNEELCLVY